eukprot:scaffold66763_cov24-Phaeocystis_antarctica.AAC.1
MVTGGDADAHGEVTMAGGAYGLGSSGPGRRRGPGVPSKRRHKRGATAGEGRWAVVGTCQHALGAAGSKALSRSKGRPGLHTCSAATAPDEVLDDDGSPQKEAVLTPYRYEGSNPGPWRLILPPGRPSQRWLRCHLARRAWKTTTPRAP